MTQYQELSRRIASLKVQATRAEGVLEQAEHQKNQARAAIQEQGYEVEALEEEVVALEEELAKGQEVLQRKINQLADILDGYKENG